ncbi:MAG: 3-hydroxyacyl-ACP dehydratase FabZ [Vulcanimicrobiota bacterium]
MNALEIRKKLPHRYPMLLLDELAECNETTAVGFKNVTMNEPFFRGHFPSAPVMPGVLVMEALCQLVWLWSGHSGVVRMTGIKKLRFRRPTMPGDRLKLELELVERDQSNLSVKVVASVEGEPAVTGVLSFALE